MARRSANWNEGLAKDLRSAEFAQEFILAALAEGLELKSVLAKVIRAYGVREFAVKIGLPSSNLVRAISQRSNPTTETLAMLLKPFHLELSAMPIQKRRRA